VRPLELGRFFHHNRLFRNVRNVRGVNSPIATTHVTCYTNPALPERFADGDYPMNRNTPNAARLTWSTAPGASICSGHTLSAHNGLRDAPQGQQLPRRAPATLEAAFVSAEIALASWLAVTVLS
jgi:hypothetical protein